MSRSILIVTPYFAPQTHAAVFRAYKLAKYLPRFGWKPYVLTVDTNYLYNNDPELLESAAIRCPCDYRSLYRTHLAWDQDGAGWEGSVILRVEIPRDVRRSRSPRSNLTRAGSSYEGIQASLEVLASIAGSILDVVRSRSPDRAELDPPSADTDRLHDMSALYVPQGRPGTPEARLPLGRRFS